MGFGLKSSVQIDFNTHKFTGLFFVPGKITPLKEINKLALAKIQSIII